MGMTWRAVVQGLGLVIGGCAMAAACGPDSEHPPPASSGMANVVPEGGPAPEGPGNLCECVAAIGDVATDGPCFTCFDDKAPGKCSAETSACQANVTCTIIIECVSQCNYTPDCVRGCMLPFDQDEGHLAYQAMVTCGCRQDVCFYECKYDQPITCEPLGPTSGAGGHGGGGGGSGGTGG